MGKWPNCKPDTTNYTNLTYFEDTLEQLELAINNFEEQTKQIDKDLFQNEFPSYGVQKIQRLKKEVDMLLRRVGLKGITQKVRICGPNEFQKRIWTFAILVILFALAALATYHLNKIASYKELFNVSKTIGCCVENSKLRVVHKSLILDAVREGEDSSSEDFSSEDFSSEDSSLED